MTGLTGRAAALLTVLAVGACSSSRGGTSQTDFERHLEAGRDSAAAEAFVADSTLHDDSDALFRAGLLFGDPASPAYDPAAARSQFRRLLEAEPSAKWERAARAYLRLYQRVDSLARQLEGLKGVDLDRPPADTTGGR